MDRHETTLNYNRHATPIGQHRERCWSTQRKSFDRDTEPLSNILSPLLDYLASNESAPSQNNPTYLAWKQAIEANGPHSHLFTIAFKRTYSDRQAMASLSDWATMMNRSIKGSRWKKNGSGLAGIAIAERHSLSIDFRGRLHFHVLIKEQEGLPSTDILRLIAYATALRLKDARGRTMTDPYRIDLREVTNEPRLMGYVLKDIYSQDWNVGDNIAFWNQTTGIGGFQFAPLSASQLMRKH